MERTTLATLTPQEIAGAFTLVYTGYFVSFAVTAESARSHIAAGSIALDASTLWRDDAGAVVGLAMLGVRGNRGWIGGFGVAPAYRGRGISHALIGGVLDTAWRRGLRTVALEVLAQNTRAIETYRRAGFVHRRDLRVFQWDAPESVGAAADVREADPATLLAHRAHVGTPPVWQREPPSIAATPGLTGLAHGAPDAPDAFLLSRASDTAVSIVDIAAARADAVAPLIGALAARFPGRRMRLANEPAESPVCGALEALGWTEVMRQHEMIAGPPTPAQRAPVPGTGGEFDAASERRA